LEFLYHPLWLPLSFNTTQEVMTHARRMQTAENKRLNVFIHECGYFSGSKCYTAQAITCIIHLSLNTGRASIYIRSTFQIISFSLSDSEKKTVITLKTYERCLTFLYIIGCLVMRAVNGNFYLSWPDSIIQEFAINDF
jgi:hypothetical protein